jgi:3-isopropylmalate dehydrogenase
MVVSQSNTLASHTLWNRTALAVGPEYPGVTIETAYPDTAASLIVTDPQSIDVIVTSAWLGGILSDLLTSVVGGKALMGSSRVNTDTRFGLFEPAHGSAPKYTGRNRVSPVATLLALCMLLEHVGETAAAAELDAAIGSALRSGRLPDITARGVVGTREATDIILDELTATERVART